METRTYTVYKFDELTDQAKEKAIERYRENDDYPFLEDSLTEYTAELLEKKKIVPINKDFEIGYSLSNCQGDGFQFVGLFEWKGYTVLIKHNGHYSHSKCVSFDIDTPNGNDAHENIYNKFKALYEKICDDAENYGYEIIDAQQDEKNIIENFEANEYMFTEKGEID